MTTETKIKAYRRIDQKGYDCPERFRYEPLGVAEVVSYYYLSGPNGGDCRLLVRLATGEVVDADPGRRVAGSPMVAIVSEVNPRIYAATPPEWMRRMVEDPSWRVLVEPAPRGESSHWEYRAEREPYRPDAGVICYVPRLPE